MSVLPVLLSIPHGGSRVPEELIGRVCIDPHDLFDDGDACTLDIYDIGERAARVVKTGIARAFIDMNRASHDRPPDNPDGVVKTATCFGRPIYEPGKEPDPALTEKLINRYHVPYHAEIRAGLNQPDIELALDCHSMVPVAPPIEIERGKPRPLFCLSNREGETAPTELVETLRSEFALAFDISTTQIGLNDPFKGGYITQTHGTGEIPFVQVEMNRSFYLESPWHDRESLWIDAARLAELRDRFMTALRNTMA